MFEPFSSQFLKKSKRIIGARASAGVAGHRQADPGGVAETQSNGC